MAPEIDILERMERAVEKVKDRMRRVCTALSQGGVPYALAGGNAVAAWVATVDEAAVRSTRDVDIVLERGDLPRAIEVLAGAGFQFRHVSGIDMFLDSGEARERDAVHVVFGGEKVRPEYPLPAPHAQEHIEMQRHIRVLKLDSLVRMKLTSFRRKDQVHVQDLISVGLVDQGWVDRMPEPLTARLQELLDDED